jgi:hypothetical protein
VGRWLAQGHTAWGKQPKVITTLHPFKAACCSQAGLGEVSGGQLSHGGEGGGGECLTQNLSHWAVPPFLPCERGILRFILDENPGAVSCVPNPDNSVPILGDVTAQGCTCHLGPQ